MTHLTTGNTAKLYCLNWLDATIQQHDGKIRILDLGCGTARNFVALLQQHPGVHYVGLEPSPAACKQARRNMQGMDGTIHIMDGYDIHQKLGETFDVVVSFSVLEHVYQRERYLRSAKASLKTGGYFLINYDAGHFKYSTQRDRAKNVVGPVLARLGVERYYQSFVHEAEFQRMIQAIGFKVVDEKFFNSGLKGIHKLIPPAQDDEYMEKWLDFELWLNEVGIVYDDDKARSFVTRNFILQG
jgi:SAM-dependent methyltransferase